ncbi:THUMP-like domain-containing protein [Planctomicrobium sp. SH661]|uniref:class I SAM-dependent methyltransferase n=1 Tax=Planctomicrobium sp. SH661 TaxID=3448124 RepID=UPI003F5B0EB3
MTFESRTAHLCGLLFPMDDEFEVLQRLVETPELFQEISQVTGTEFQRQAALREQYDAALVRGAMLLSELRAKARQKFSRADQMWFDRTGLEQSTAELIARHKAQRFTRTAEPVYDLCCGIGSDSIALAAMGNQVTSVDLSPMSCLRTQLNAAVYGVAERITTQVASAERVKLQSAYVHIDPDRRTGRQRAVKLEDYAPPLEFLQRLTEQTPGGGIKLSPASNFGGKFGPCEIELISLDGECKEATVWYGELSGPQAMRASILPAGYSIAGNPWELRPHVGRISRYVYDPDPAIVRAGLLDLLVEESGFRRLDASEEYLTSEELIDSPAAAPFEVLFNLPNNETEIRKTIRQGNWGEVEIKSRHVPTNADAMRKKMSLTGKGPVTLIIARVDGRTRALVCRRVKAAQDSEISE